MHNTYSTYASLFTETPNAAVAFDRWMAERIQGQEAAEEIKNELRDFLKQDNVRLSAAVDAYDSDIKEGQIRILSKRFTDDPDVIPYVVVLERWNKDMWLVAPFSQYGTPATPGEMKTGLDIYGLRVLQAWNARTVQPCLLEKSWLCREVGDALRKQALALFRHEFGGKELPADFSAERGSPIIFEADPRCDFQAESIARLRPLSTAVKATERILSELEEAKSTSENEDLKSGILRIDFMRSSVLDTDDYALAAGDAEKQKTEDYSVGDDELSVTHSPEEKVSIFTFYDQDDKPEVSYDGYGLLGGEVEFLGTFKDGTLRVPTVCIKEGFQIVDSDGNAVKVTPRG